MVKTKGYKIYFVNHGIASRFPNKVIEVHSKMLLPEYNQLLFQIIKHEMEHTDVGYSKKDLLLDLNLKVDKKKYWKFVLTTPSSWVQFSPIYKSRGMWFIDRNMIIAFAIWILLLLAFSTIWIF